MAGEVSRACSRMPALPWLFAEGFVLLGAFVTVYNYTGYRLMAPPFSHSARASVGLLFSVYLVGTFSSTFIGHLAGRLGRRKVLWSMFVIMLAGLALTLAQSVWVIIAGHRGHHVRFFRRTLHREQLGRTPGGTRTKAQANSMYLFVYYLGSEHRRCGRGRTFLRPTGVDGRRRASPRRCSRFGLAVRLPVVFCAAARGAASGRIRTADAVNLKAAPPSLRRYACVRPPSVPPRRGLC